MDLSTLDPRYSLRARIAFVVATLTLTLAVILTAITGLISGQQLERSIGQTLGQLSAMVVGQLDQTLFERWREIRLTASQSALYASSANSTSVRTLLGQVKETYRYYSWLGWADPSGKIVASTGGLLEGQSVAAASWFQQAQASPLPFINDIHEEPQLAHLLDNTDSQPERFIDIAMPIHSSQGELLGVLGAVLDWHFMQEQASSIERQFDRQLGIADADVGQVDVFVVAADGTVLVGPPSFSALTMAQLPRLSQQSLQAARSGQLGYLAETWPDRSGLYLTGYAKDNGYRGYPGLGWVVLIRERADLALASVIQLQALLLIIGVGCAIIFLAVGWLLALQITRPLVRVVQHAHEIKIGDGQDLSPAQIGRADEVLVLSNTIDRLLVSLNSRNTQLIELNGNLERRIQERTAELAASQRFNEEIVSTVPDMIYIFDLEQERNVYVNQAAKGLSGYSVEEMGASGNRLPLDIIHPDDLGSFLAHRDRILQASDGELIEQSYRIKHRDGHWGWAQCRETVFARDAAGKVTQIFGVAQDVTLRKHAEDELQETAAAQERQRLARELHDSVSQTLFSATMIAQTLPLLWDKGEDVVKKNLDELTRLTRGALAEMRTLLNELRPTAIETADLGELLSQLLDAARGRTSAECTLAIDGDGGLPPEVQVSLYRVAQEALNNITKHARARHVKVRLVRDEEGVVLSISDDGRGFQPDQALSDHFGLGIMNERAQEVGASVTVHSEPGQGTEVLFTWKVPERVGQRAREVGL